MKVFERRILGLSKHLVKQSEILAEKQDISSIPKYAAENLGDNLAKLLLHAREADSSFPMQSLWTVLFCTYYVGTRGKTTEEIERLVNKIENISKINKKAAKKRGEQSSAEAEEVWRSRARVEVQSIITKHPKFNQKMVIKKVFETWPKDIDPPPEESLKKYVVRPIFNMNVNKKKNAVVKSPSRREKP